MTKNGVDGSWHVALITFLTVLVTTVALKNSGFIYVGFMQEFGIDRESASWPSSALGAAIHGGGVFVGLTQRWFCVYQMGLLGSVLVWAGMIASSFAPNITWATLTFALHGFGVGMVSITLGMALLHYFSKYRGTASGIMFSGETTCALVFPEVLLLIRDTYNFRSVFLIYGAIALNTTALCVLLKRPPWINRNGTYKNILPPENHGQPTCEIPLKSGIEDLLKTTRNGEKPTNTWHVFKLFRQPAFYLVCAVAVTVHYSQIMYLTTIVDFAIDRGASLEQASTIIMYLSPADFCGRIILPHIADKGYLPPNALVVLCYLLVGIAMVGLPQVYSFASMMLLCAFIEIGIGCVLTMKMLLIANYIHQELYAASYGFTGLAILPVFLCNPLILGFFRDYLGAYDDLYRVMGAISLLMAILFSCLTWKEIRTRHRVSVRRIGD
ncbi:monocarboxylate transporter, putative [Ixodes scapularis]|uniref:Monocarboxylate transporter, putative n=1 Tax=Ixodes scapularis TaxID=6945 RepID=B7Q852_IXOSC|nr:monocarboxylate transporter, putative [Ixodes scapularis]|eukprot:XP_002412288.1 monocarboxylate transporter, putative [Ixodes scapularis]